MYKGRHEYECLHILEDTIDDGIKENSYLLLIDQEKAFDRIEAKWLINVLEGFVLGPDLIKWIKILYKHAQIAIVTNGGDFKVFSCRKRYSSM